MASNEEHYTLPRPEFDKPVKILIVVAPYYKQIAEQLVAGAIAEIEHILSLPSGYHRDLQGTKPPLIRAHKRIIDALTITVGLLEELQVDEGNMREAIEPSMYATDLAVELATSGTPFREAYRQVADSLDTLADRTPEQSLSARTSPGACANLMLDTLRARFDALNSKDG